MKILPIPAQTSLKTELNPSRSALFHIKTTVSLKYYVRDCRPRNWNSLPIECFSLTHDLNFVKSRINMHLLTVGSFLRQVLQIGSLNRFSAYLNLFVFLFLVLRFLSLCLVVAVQPCMSESQFSKKCISYISGYLTSLNKGPGASFWCTFLACFSIKICLMFNISLIKFQYQTFSLLKTLNTVFYFPFRHKNDLS